MLFFIAHVSDRNYESRIRTTLKSTAYGNDEHETVTKTEDLFSRLFRCFIVTNYQHLHPGNKPISLPGLNVWRIPMLNLNINKLGKFDSFVRNELIRFRLFSILNLELMWDYGANTWKMYNTTLQTMLEQAQKQLLELRYDQKEKLRLSH